MPQPTNLRVVPPTIPAFEAAVNRRASGLAVTRELVNRALVQGTKKGELAYDAKLKQLLAPAEPYPGVLPAGRKAAKIAMDEQTIQVAAWSQQWQATSSLMEGQGFLGYTALAEFAQRPEYRAIVETIAYEMTREGVEVKSKGEDESSEKEERIGVVKEKIKELKVLQALGQAAAHDGFYGRGHIFVDTTDIDFDDRSHIAGKASEELKKSIGDGRGHLSKAKVAKGSLKRFKNVEPVWTYPTRYNSSNPLADSWYKPSEWFVMGTEIHSSRLLTLVGREVPDILKPAYSFGGLSLTQMAMPYVQNWLRTRQAVSDLVWSFTVFVLATNMSETMQVDGELLFNRAQLFNNMRNNQGLMLLDKDLEEFQNVSASLGGLHELQAQAQEHLSAVSRIPLVKLLGIQPAGLNASSEGEIRVFYDNIHAYQEHLFADPLRRMVDFIQLSEFGDVDSDLEISFNPLWQLDEAGKIAIQKTKTDIDDANLAMGVITAKTIARRLAADPESQYHGIDLEEELEDAELEQAQEEFEQQQQQMELALAGGGGNPNEQGAPPSAEEQGKGEPPPEQLGEHPPGKTPPPRDPANRLASSVTNTAAKVGGAGGEGFKEAADEWKENEHPRGEGGKFGAGGSSKAHAPSIPLRPDNRPTEVVRHWFDKAFEDQDYPNVSWALGSDWGMGSRPLTAEEYKAAAYKRFAAIYGAVE